MPQKVIVRNLVWVKRAGLPEFINNMIVRDLIIKPRSSKEFGERPPIRCFHQDEEWIGLPRYYFDKEVKNFYSFDMDYQVGNGFELSKGERKFTPRDDDQVPAIDYMIKHLSKGEHNGGILSAHVGFGKSLSALEIARNLGRNTLVVLHRGPLLRQWKRTLDEFFGGYSSGMVQAAKINFEGKDFVFAMLQTLMTSTKIPDHFWNYFGTVIYDECHIMGAEKFGSVAPRMNARHVMGLSGTVRRLDGCEKVFKHVIGDIAFKASQKNRLHPDVYVRRTPLVLPSRDIPKAILLNRMRDCKERNKTIAVDVFNAALKGRNPLVMSERKDMLYMIAEYVNYFCKMNNIKPFEIGFYLGGMKEEQHLEASTKQIVMTTVQCAKEGIDIKRLDTLFLCTNMADPEQAIGRVTRTMEGKKKPMVLDYVDDHPKTHKSFKSRLRMYESLGWKVYGLEKIGLK